MRIAKRLKLFDFLVLALSLCAAAAAGFGAFSRSQGTPYVIIETPKNTWIYALSENTTVTIEGTIGITEVHIQDSFVFFAESACAGKTCTQTPPISKAGQWIACMPNQVFARISAQTDTQNDADIDIIVH